MCWWFNAVVRLEKTNHSRFFCLICHHRPQNLETGRLLNRRYPIQSTYLAMATGRQSRGVSYQVPLNEIA